MSIVTIFYLADISNILRFFFAVSAACLVVFFVFIFMAKFSSSMDKDDDEEKRANLYLKKVVPLFFIFLIALILTPSKQTIFIYGGQQAIAEISKNKDSQEIVSLIKEITINKLRELNKSGEDK